jgi:hypothetical protein
LDLAVALDAGVEQGAAGGDTASEDRPAPVVLRGAIAQQDGGRFQRRTECRSEMDAEALQEGAVVAVRFEGEEGAFSGKP